jgi:hypothetical protein
MIPTTTKRVIHNTNRRVNDSICEKTCERVAHYASATPQMLEQRLCELDHEWDVERITATCVALGMLGGVLLVTLFGEGWLVVPLLLATFLLLHALVGWSPLLPLIRRGGCRTADEIALERYALKALRGDFQRLDVVTTPQDREDLARFEGEGGPPAPEPDRPADAAHPDAAHPAVVHEAIRAAQS